MPLPELQAGESLKLYLQVEGLQAAVGYSLGGKDVPVADHMDIRSLSTEVAGGFVGCTVGIYATGIYAAKVDDASAEERRVLFTDLSYRRIEM